MYDIKEKGRAIGKSGYLIAGMKEKRAKAVITKGVSFYTYL